MSNITTRACVLLSVGVAARNGLLANLLRRRPPKTQRPKDAGRPTHARFRWVPPREFQFDPKNCTTNVQQFAETHPVVGGGFRRWFTWPVRARNGNNWKMSAQTPARSHRWKWECPWVTAPPPRTKDNTTRDHNFLWVIAVRRCFPLYHIASRISSVDVLYTLWDKGGGGVVGVFGLGPRTSDLAVTASHALNETIRWG